MARRIYARLTRPWAVFLLLSFSLLMPIGLKAIIGADDAGTGGSVEPPLATNPGAPAPASADPPSNPSPANAATAVPLDPSLCVTVTDTTGDPMTVTFHGRVASGASGNDFTIIALPDTQYYSKTYPQIFAAQTQWIRDNRVSRNIAFVTQLGDCTNNADEVGQEYQWANASTAIDTLETAPGLPDGIPYGIAVGNHDNGDGDGTGHARVGTDEGASTVQYTRTFGLERACPGTCAANPQQACEKDADCGTGICNPGTQCKSYFGGRYDFGAPTTYFRNTDNHYELFSAGGMDFIIFHLEWDCADGVLGCEAPGVASPVRQQVIDWMDNLLTGVYANRRAIIVAHHLLTPSGNPPPFSNQGQAVYDSVLDDPNVFMTLSGHLDQASRRRDEPQPGHVIHSMMSDYQTRPNGGDGWLRILTFHPRTNTIDVQTYSPYLQQFINNHPDNVGTALNEFTLDYQMDPGVPFTPLGTQPGVSSGSQVCVAWPGRGANTTYEWYAEVSDGVATITGPRWTFTTACSNNAECDDHNDCTTDDCTAGVCANAAVQGCCNTAADCNDANTCTDDSCVANACQHADNVSACTDGDACTAPDTCSAGACQPGAAVSCDDNNACTADSCAAASGCAHAYVPSPGCCVTNADCNDGLLTTTDTCLGGSCSNAPNQLCAGVADCNDGNACTRDVCDGANAAALAFSGAAGNRVEFPIGGGVDYLNNFGTGSFTIEGWVYTDGAPASLTGIFRAGRQQAFPQVALQLSGVGNIQIAASVETNVPGTQIDVVGPPLEPNTWTHVAMVVDRTPGGQELRLHLNGGAPTAIGANTWGPYPISWTSDPTVLGAARDGNGNLTLPFDGRLDEFRIWNYARTQAEIGAGMNLEIASAPGLMHHWGMNEGLGAAVADSVGASTGTILNGPAWITAIAEIPTFGTGICQHVFNPGCVSCSADAQCDDGDACTTDSCAAGACQHAALSCDDGDACTTDTCDSQTGSCSHPFAPAGTACADADPCSTGATCDGAGACGGGTVQSCDDGNACTAELCSGAPAQNGVGFDGVDDRIDFGAAATHPDLGLTRFTVEFWFQRTGTGVETPFSVALGSAMPIVTKGRGVGDGGPIDLNYFVGIRNGVVVGDFESFEAPGGNNDNLVVGSTPIALGTWYHAALTYDGAALKLYLNGLPEASLTTTLTPRSDSLHPFSIGSAMDGQTNPATPGGFFAGEVDEVRVWNYARSGASILAARDRRVAAEPGLVGRFGLDETSGLTALDSSGNANHGTLMDGATRVPGAPALSAVECSSSPVADGVSCSDGNLCNGAETCQSATCTGGVAPDCDDHDPCTDDLCAALTGCGHVDNTAPCDDGIACTGNDTCSGGTCAGSVLPAGTACSDGDRCTTGDTCNGAGACIAAAPTCDDANACTDDACDATNRNGAALNFNGTSSYVTMGAAAGEAALGARAFTLETWIRRDGATWGTSTSTGNGGITAIPLITKGRGEDDGSPVDCNYFLGIIPDSATPTTVKLAADFEQLVAGNGGVAGQNRPACGTLAIADQSWHHVAVTYSAADGWRFYLDGVEGTAPDGTSCATCNGSICTRNPGVEPRYDSIQHFGLGVALTSTGDNPSPSGLFGGMMDEPRVWSYARTGNQIRAGMSMQIPQATGLIGRWGLNEGSGASAADSTSPAQDGTLVNGPAWVTTVQDFGQCDFVPDDTNSCADANACTADACAGGQCVGTAIAGCCQTNADCNDGNLCTADSCVANVCQFAPIPGCTACTADAQCDDANSCTSDSCNTANDAAISFAGTAGNRLELPIGSGVDYVNNFGDGSFTIEGWIHTDGGAADLTGIFRMGRQQAFPQVVLQLRGTGNLQIAASVETNQVSPTTQVDLLTPTPLSANQWHHVAMVVDRTPGSQQLRVHIDGGAAISTNANLWGTNPISWTTDATVLGAARDGNGNLILPFDGRLDEFRIWNFARTQSQVATDMNREIVSAPGLVHRWGMNDGTLTSVADSVGTSTGTLASSTAPAPGWSLANLPTFGNDLCVHAAVNDGQACDDGNGCTQATTCSSGVCGGGSALNCAAFDTQCTVGVCDAQAGQCVAVPRANGATCDDGNACTTGDVCGSGTCAGTPLVCNDNNECTTDSCSAGVCVFTNNTNACDDGNACTTGDVCGNGTCAGTPLVCNDNNECTTDSCSAGVCVFTNNTNACDDGNACTTGDVCGGGTCAGTPLVCNDNNECTTDSCSAGVCVFTNNTNACDDGNACTTGDVCGNGTCAGTPLVCNDNNECTTDSCSAGVCVFTNNTNACDDGNACTTGDVCGGGTCAGTPLVCNDNNECTTDSCSAGVCVFTNNSNACDDGNACTTGDVCGGGTCAGTPLVCNDNNECTTDSCSAGVCVFTNNTNACDDGNACTTGDVCGGGTCAGTPLVCNDNNECTTDSCSAGVCVFTNNTNACDDGNACTTGDVCGGGTCAGSPVVCDDGNACTTDLCSGGACIFTNNTNACDDGNACTTGDTCGGGTCAGTPLVCDDNDSCTTDSCVAGACQFAVNPTPGEVQNVGIGELVPESTVIPLTWDPTPGAVTYNVYRGGQSNLSDLSCFLPGVTSTSAVDDGALPPLDAAFFYLVTAENCSGESTLGTTSSGAVRSAALSCP